MLIIVRHGRTEANAQGLLLGHADPALDELGRVQAAALAAAVGAEAMRGGRSLARVVSSPLARCRETAATFGLPVEVDERWIELDYGDYDGRPVADVPTETWRAWRRDLTFAPPNGESLAALSARVSAALDDLAAASAGAGADGSEGDVVVVTHVSPIKAALAWALGVGPQVSWRAYVAPASVMRVALGERGPSLHGFNDTSHLYP